MSAHSHPILSDKRISSLREILFMEVKDSIKEKIGNEKYEKAIILSGKVRVFAITYESNGHVVAGYIVEPRELINEMPAIIFNRGGTKDFGAIKMGTLFYFLAEMASWGYIVFASQYSGGPGSEGEDEWGGADLHDVITIYDIAKNHPNIDSKRFGMVGVSRGGMMTYLALKKLPGIKAAVISSGATNLIRSREFRPEMWAMYQELFGENVENECRKRSIVFSADELPNTTPLLIMHGTADWRVSPEDALEISNELLRHKKPYRLIMYEGADHGLTEVHDEAMQETRNWLDHFVKNGASLPNLEPHGD